MKSKFGDLISNARIQKGLTLRALAKSIGLAPSYISELEHGIKQPPRDEVTILRLASALDMRSDVLIEAAKGTRALRGATDFLSKVLGSNNDLAFHLFRAAEDQPRERLDDLSEKIKDLIQKWEKEEKPTNA